MVYSLGILTLLGIFIVGKDIGNRFNWTVAGLLTGVILMIITILMTSILSDPVYGYAQIRLFHWDRFFFSMLQRKIAVSYFTVSYVGNLAITIYTISLFLLMEEYQEKKKRVWKAYVITSVLFILYANLYRPNKTAYLMFLMYHGDVGKNMYLIAFGLYAVYIVLLAAVLIFPLYIIILYYREIYTSFLKNQVASIFLFIVLLNVFLFYEYTAGPMGLDLQSAIRIGFWRDVGSSDYVSNIEYLLWPVLIAFLTVMILITTYKYKKRGYFSFQQPSRISRKIEKVNDNMKGILHSYKNTLFTMQLYTRQIEEAQSEVERQTAIEKLQKLQESSIGDVSRTLDNLKNVKNVRETSELSECISLVLKKIPIPDQITLNLDQCMKSAWINIPEPYMIRVLENVLLNALEAMELMEHGSIEIESRREKEYIFLSVKNDGPIIKKRELRKIFQPYYSTKHKNRNWGIGLSYVSKVITAYCGYVWAESSEADGVKICFLLEAAHGK